MSRCLDILRTIEIGIADRLDCLLLLYLKTLRCLSSPSNAGIPLDLQNWSFGQILAVTVWIAPIAQYIYLERSRSH